MVMNTETGKIHLLYVVYWEDLYTIYWEGGDVSKK